MEVKIDDSKHSLDELSEEYVDEARDAVRSLLGKEKMITRSISPNHFSMQRKQRVGKSSLLNSTTNELKMEERAKPRHLEDLPRQELEGAPPGWERMQRTRENSQTLAIAANVCRRSSASPAATSARLDVHRPSAAREKRVSQMSFGEWCQTKKLQELHDAAMRSRRNSKEEEHPKNFKRNISYEEWSKVTEERQRNDAIAHEKQKLREEEEREAMETIKYKRRMSFDQWKITKDAAKFSNERSKEAREESKENDEDRRKKALEAHGKWMIKKEVEEIKKDRDMLLRMQNASLGFGAASANTRKRRTSWIDGNAALQVQANRGHMPS